MAQYINKNKLKTILRDLWKRDGGHKSEYNKALQEVLRKLDTFKVKEVDLNKEISQFIDANFEKATLGHKLSLRRIAKHFFELGLTQVIDLNLPRTLIVYENKLYEANWIPRGCKDKCENCPINLQCASEDMSLCEQYGLNPNDMYIVKELT